MASHNSNRNGGRGGAQHLEALLDQFFNVWASNIDFDLGTDLGAASASSSSASVDVKGDAKRKRPSAVNLPWHLGASYAFDLNTGFVELTRVCAIYFSFLNRYRTTSTASKIEAARRRFGPGYYEP